jgi:hypothetical protein
MALTYANYAGNKSIKDTQQIARNGNIKLYYIDDEIDLLRDVEPDYAIKMVSDLVDQAANDLNLLNINSKKLNDLDCDIYNKSCPTRRIDKKLFNDVKDKIAAKESKFYYPKNGNIRLIPRLDSGQTDRLYISGQSGSGKSTFCSNYALEYQKEFPGNRVFLLSYKPFDPAFDDVIPNLIRPKLNRQFVNDVYGNPNSNIDDYFCPIDKFRDSLVIFDDFECIPDQFILKSILHLKDLILQMGRAYNIYVCSVQHKSLGGSKSTVDLCESNILVCFPRTNLSECIKTFDRYCSFTKDQLDRVFDERTKKQRFLVLIKPNIIITPNFIKIID